MSAQTITKPEPQYSVDTSLFELLPTTESSPTLNKVAVCIYPYFELRNYLYILYQSLTAADNSKISDIALNNFCLGRDTIISIDKLEGSRFNLRISSSKTGIKSWHQNNWCLNKNKIAYVVLDALELEPFTMAVEELIEEVETYEF